MPRCVLAELQLARELVSAGAHVETACARLRRALSATLAGDSRAARHELVLLCDLSQTDDDAVDLALWVSDDEGTAQSAATAARLLSEAMRALGELVSRRRGAGACPLLAAALRLRVRPPPPPPVSSPSIALVVSGVLVPLLLLASATGAAFAYRRQRRRAALRERERDNKTNNLQNEENLRRYIRPAPPSPAPQQHNLKPQNNADKACCHRDSLTVVV